jgi:hypothetical protein
MSKIAALLTRMSIRPARSAASRTVSYRLHRHPAARKTIVGRFEPRDPQHAPRDIGDDDLRSSLGKGFDNSASDTAGATRNEGHLVFQR